LHRAYNWVFYFCDVVCLPGQRDALTPLERITEAGNDGHHDMAAWEPFSNNVDMDEEVC